MEESMENRLEGEALEMTNLLLEARDLIRDLREALEKINGLHADIGEHTMACADIASKALALKSL